MEYKKISKKTIVISAISALLLYKLGKSCIGYHRRSQLANSLKQLFKQIESNPSKQQVYIVKIQNLFKNYVIDASESTTIPKIKSQFSKTPELNQPVSSFSCQSYLNLDSQIVYNCKTCIEESNNMEQKKAYCSDCIKAGHQNHKVEPINAAIDFDVLLFCICGKYDYDHNKIYRCDKHMGITPQVYEEQVKNSKIKELIKGRFFEFFEELFRRFLITIYSLEVQNKKTKSNFTEGQKKIFRVQYYTILSAIDKICDQHIVFAALLAEALQEAFYLSRNPLRVLMFQGDKQPPSILDWMLYYNGLLSDELLKDTQVAIIINKYCMFDKQFIIHFEQKYTCYQQSIVQKQLYSTLTQNKLPQSEYFIPSMLLIFDQISNQQELLKHIISSQNENFLYLFAELSYLLLAELKCDQWPINQGLFVTFIICAKKVMLSETYLNHFMKKPQQIDIIIQFLVKSMFWIEYAKGYNIKVKEILVELKNDLNTFSFSFYYSSIVMEILTKYFQVIQQNAITKEEKLKNVRKFYELCFTIVETQKLKNQEYIYPGFIINMIRLQNIIVSTYEQKELSLQSLKEIKDVYDQVVEKKTKDPQRMNVYSYNNYIQGIFLQYLEQILGFKEVEKQILTTDLNLISQFQVYQQLFSHCIYYDKLALGLILQFAMEQSKELFLSVVAAELEEGDVSRNLQIDLMQMFNDDLIFFNGFINQLSREFPLFKKKWLIGTINYFNLCNQPATPTLLNSEFRSRFGNNYSLKPNELEEIADFDPITQSYRVKSQLYCQYIQLPRYFNSKKQVQLDQKFVHMTINYFVYNLEYEVPKFVSEIRLSILQQTQIVNLLFSIFSLKFCPNDSNVIYYLQFYDMLLQTLKYCLATKQKLKTLPIILKSIAQKELNFLVDAFKKIEDIPIYNLMSGYYVQLFKELTNQKFIDEISQNLKE